MNSDVKFSAICSLTPSKQPEVGMIRVYYFYTIHILHPDHFFCIFAQYNFFQ